MLVLSLGHSPLYRHFCKRLYIELKKLAAKLLLSKMCTNLSANWSKTMILFPVYDNSDKNHYE